jgi:hypothetical protein
MFGTERALQPIPQLGVSHPEDDIAGPDPEEAGRPFRAGRMTGRASGVLLDELEQLHIRDKLSWSASQAVDTD